MDKNNKKTKEEDPNSETTLENEKSTNILETTQKSCGIVMPIAKMSDKYTEQHWIQVLTIIREACAVAGFKDAKLVSDSESVNMIHKDIVQNLYTDDIIICDVSARNPNVFFELGMRLSFDKPVVIIKDYETNFTFDIGGIRHLEYPFDLNYHSIKEFQKKLSKQIISTIKSYEDPQFTTFIKHFKDIKLKPTKLESKEVSVEQATLMNIQNELNSLRRTITESQQINKNDIKENLIAEDINSAVKVLGDSFVRTLTSREENLILAGQDKMLDDLFKKWLLLNYPELGYDKLSANDISFLKQLIKDYQLPF